MSRRDRSQVAPPHGQWRLPAGVPRGIWDYAHSPDLAAGYDASLATSALVEFDEQVLARHLPHACRVVDLGCGTGRHAVALARRGCQVLAIDLSPHMLRVVGERAAAERLTIDRLRANIVELECLADGFADACISMFSTLAMVRSRAHRRRVLAHVARMLKHGGLFVMHVHNRWTNLRSREGRAWLARDLWRSLATRNHELGDKYFDAWGVAGVYLHLYTRRELKRELGSTGFEIVEWIPLEPSGRGPLPSAWCFEGLRAGGWTVVSRTRV